MYALLVLHKLWSLSFISGSECEHFPHLNFCTIFNPCASSSGLLAIVQSSGLYTASTAYANDSNPELAALARLVIAAAETGQE